MAPNACRYSYLRSQIAGNRQIKYELEQEWPLLTSERTTQWISTTDNKTNFHGEKGSFRFVDEACLHKFNEIHISGKSGETRNRNRISVKFLQRE